MFPPRRIASLLASATEILYGLGRGDCVVAVSHECDFPDAVKAKPRATFSHVDSSRSSEAIDEEVRRRMAQGEPLYSVDSRLLATLAPDLIITQAQCDVCAVRYEDVLGAVRDTPELRSAEVLSLNPLSLAEVFDDITRIAQATGADAAGARYIAQLTARVAAVRTRSEQIPLAQRPRVAMVEWIEPIFLAANWMPQLLAGAGGDDGGFGRQGEHSTVARWEDLRDFDPQMILVMPCGFDLARTADEAQALAKLAGWRDVAAVRSDNVWALDGNAYFNRSGPRLVDSLEILAYLLHPGLHAPPQALQSDSAWRRLAI